MLDHWNLTPGLLQQQNNYFGVNRALHLPIFTYIIKINICAINNNFINILKSSNNILTFEWL